MRSTMSLLPWLLLACHPETTEPTGDDDDDDVPTGDTGAPDDTGDPSGTGSTGDTAEPEPPVFPALVVAELMTDNGSTVNGPDGLSLPDWVELLNADEAPIALDRLQLRDGGSGVWIGSAADGELAPGERRIVWFGEGTDGGPWTGFGLDSDGDELNVVIDGRLAQTIEVPALGEDVALARFPEATGELVVTALPTPGQPNGEGPSATTDPADETWFRTGVVHRIDFQMPAGQLSDLDRPDRPEVHTAVRVDGVQYADIGLKLKGSASYSQMSGKPAFIVDFNQWVPGTGWRGLHGFKLHNGNVYDPTRVRDHLTYGLAREAGLMAPRVGWAQVFVNGDDYGIYMVIERHDDRFVSYFHPEQAETGVVIEPNELEGGGWGGDFGQGMALEWNVEEGPTPPDPASVAALAAVDEIVTRASSDANLAEFWQNMDQDLFLTYLAWETVVSHTDGYKVTNNWRVYVDGTTHKVSLLPSGVEMTWMSRPTPWQYLGRAARFCFANDDCDHAFAEKVIEVADLADAMNLDDDFVAQSTFLDPWIQSDPRYSSTFMVEMERESTHEALQENPESARDTVLRKYPDLAP